MAVVDATERAVTLLLGSSLYSLKNTNVFVVGDGKYPVTAACLALFLSPAALQNNWRFFSIDPILEPDYLETTIQQEARKWETFQEAQVSRRKKGIASTSSFGTELLTKLKWAGELALNAALRHPETADGWKWLYQNQFLQFRGLSQDFDMPAVLKEVGAPDWKRFDLMECAECDVEEGGVGADSAGPGGGVSLKEDDHVCDKSSSSKDDPPRTGAGAASFASTLPKSALPPSSSTTRARVSDAAVRSQLSIVVACHSHAPLKEFWDRVPEPKIAVTLPCCENYCDLGMRPTFQYDDFEIFSPKRRIRIYGPELEIESSSHSANLPGRTGAMDGRGAPAHRRTVDGLLAAGYQWVELPKKLTAPYEGVGFWENADGQIVPGPRQTTRAERHARRVQNDTVSGTREQDEDKTDSESSAFNVLAPSKRQRGGGGPPRRGRIGEEPDAGTDLVAGAKTPEAQMSLCRSSSEDGGACSSSDDSPYDRSPLKLFHKRGPAASKGDGKTKGGRRRAGGEDECIMPTQKNGAGVVVVEDEANEDDCVLSASHKNVAVGTGVVEDDGILEGGTPESLDQGGGVDEDAEAGEQGQGVPREAGFHGEVEVEDLLNGQIVVESGGNGPSRENSGSAEENNRQKHALLLERMKED